VNDDPDRYYPSAPWLRKPPTGGRPRTVSSPPTLADTEKVFGRWLHLPDPMPLRAVLAGVVGHHYGADSPWPLLVGPTSGGKTALLAPLQRIRGVNYEAVINRAGVLTADRPKRGHPVNARRVLAPPFANGNAGVVQAAPGHPPIIVFGDFTAQTGSGDEVRTQLFDDLRHISDGWWNRTLYGFDFRWASAEVPEHATVIGGVTNTAISTAMADFGAKGQRFVFCRPPCDEEVRIASALRAIGRGVSSERMHADLSITVAAFVDGIGAPAFFDHPDHHAVGQLAGWVARGRSLVPRDRQGHQEGDAETEGPSRMARNLVLTYSAARAMGYVHIDADALMRRVAIDSLHLGRRRVIETIGRGGSEWRTPTLAEAMHDENAYVRRLCSDLEAHGILGRGGGDHWSLMDGAAEWLVDRRQAEGTTAAPAAAVNPELHWTDEIERMEEDAKHGW